MGKYYGIYRLSGKISERSYDIESTSVRGRRRNKETWSDTEMKIPWEQSQGRNEPHITVQGNP